MQAQCNDLERILRDADPTEMAALETHAASCRACAEELRAWKKVAAAARELRDDWQSPALWSRIEASLSAEAHRKAPRPAGRWSWLAALTGKLTPILSGSSGKWTRLSLSWQTAAAAALLVVLSASAGWLILHRPKPLVPEQIPSLITDERLREVERAEAAYEQAINKLEAEAKPQLENPATPLLANYREKLLVIDSAIDELRAEAGKNPGNAHLRRELLAMYQEKQNTLQEILVDRFAVTQKEEKR